MDSQAPSTSPFSSSQTVTLNRRSLLKGSATIAALTVAGSAMGLLATKAEAAPILAASNSDHVLIDFPGGI